MATPASGIPVPPTVHDSDSPSPAPHRDDAGLSRISERALAESDARYRRVLDLLPDGVLKEAGGTVRFANQAMAKLVGSECPADLVGRAVSDLVHPDDRTALQPTDTRPGSGESAATNPPPTRCRLLRRDGSATQCEMVRTAITVDGGAPGTLAVFRDVSDRLRHEEAMRENEERLALIYNHVSDVLFFMRVERTPSGVVTEYRCESVNAPLLAMTGRTPEWYVGRSLREIVPPARYDMLRARYDDAVRTGEAQQFEYAADGVNGPMMFETTLTPVRARDGRCTHVLGANRDVTARRGAEAALQRSEATFRTMLENVRSIAATLDREGRVTFANDALLTLTGWTRAEVLGGDWFSRFTTEPDALRRVYARMIDGQAVIPHFESEIRTRDGRRRLIVWDTTVLHDRDGTIMGSASIGQDVTDQRAMEARLASLSEHDELTGLFNRRGFVSRVDDAIRRARRERSKDALLFIDLDKFKPINDTYGHAAGDEALRCMGDLLQLATRQTDIVGRLGGDEFAIYAVGSETDDAAALLARRLDLLLTEHNRLEADKGRPYALEFSLGTAWVQPDDTRDTLFARADAALYRVKRSRSVPSGVPVAGEPGAPTTASRDVRVAAP